MACARSRARPGIAAHGAAAPGAGPVDAVERSAAFAERLTALTRRDRLGPGRIWQTDLKDAPLPRGHYDLIFARWVFLFLPDPAAHLRKLVRALKPGGRIALQDYHRETLALVPRPDDWFEFLAADRAFSRRRGATSASAAGSPALSARRTRDHRHSGDDQDRPSRDAGVEMAYDLFHGGHRPDGGVRAILGASRDAAAARMAGGRQA